MYDTRWISGGYCKQIRSSAWLEHYTDNVGVTSSNLVGSTLREERLVRSLPTDPGGLAQLARAPALHAGGQRFESVILHIHPPKRKCRWKKRVLYIKM